MSEQQGDAISGGGACRHLTGPDLRRETGLLPASAWLGFRLEHGLARRG